MLSNFEKIFKKSKNNNKKIFSQVEDVE